MASTFLLIWLFSFRNFAAGIIYSKTETAQVALLGLLILGDPLSITTCVAIAVSLIGVLVLSVGQSKVMLRNLYSSLYEKPTLIGLACGAALGTSVVAFKGAALSLGGDGFLMQAGMSLAVSLVMQTAIMGIYLAVMALGQIELVFAILISTGFFREKIKRTELTGIVFIVVGILILVLA